MDADVATSEPEFKLHRTCAGSERDRAVGRAAVSGQDVANVEIAHRRRRLSFPHADRSAEYSDAVAKQRRSEAPAVDDQARVAQDGAAERGARYPARCPVRQYREAPLLPKLA